MDHQSEIRVGTPQYEQHVREEIEHYSRIFSPADPDGGRGQPTLLQPVPQTWLEVERRASALVQTATGNNLTGHLLDRLSRRRHPRMLSLGAGPGGIELAVSRYSPQARILCMDLNPSLLDIGREAARRDGLPVEFQEADLNVVELPDKQFDVVLCHAALHHVLELEHLAAQIKRALRPPGELVVVDVITDRGYRMWPETRDVVRALWGSLPARFKINHTAYAKPRLDEQIWESDTSASGMECIRSQDILPVLNANFTAVHYVPYFSICRRFLDTMYGPNYDLSSPLDMALFNWIWELDVNYIGKGRLQPETFFGIYRP